MTAVTGKPRFTQTTTSGPSSVRTRRPSLLSSPSHTVTGCCGSHPGSDRIQSANPTDASIDRDFVHGSSRMLAQVLFNTTHIFGNKTTIRVGYRLQRHNSKHSQIATIQAPANPTTSLVPSFLLPTHQTASRPPSYSPVASTPFASSPRPPSPSSSPPPLQPPSPPSCAGAPHNPADCPISAAQSAPN